MKILKGIVSGVVDKGTFDKPWAIVGIEAKSVNRNGLIETTLYELSVFGKSAADGLHNTYRALQGAEVYAPFEVQYNEKYKDLNYQLAGIPLRIAEQRPAQAGPSQVKVG